MGLHTRIIVIGCPGAGKSTLSRKIAEKLNLPLYHLDMIWHKPDKTTITKEEFDRRLFEIMQTDLWVIDGNYQRTLEQRILAADTIVFLDFSTQDCIDGVKSRVGIKRPDMPWIENQLDPEFKKLIVEFETTKKPKIYELLSTRNDKKIYILKTRNDCNSFISNLVK